MVKFWNRRFFTRQYSNFSRKISWFSLYTPIVRACACALTLLSWRRTDGWRALTGKRPRAITEFVFPRKWNIESTTSSSVECITPSRNTIIVIFSEDDREFYFVSTIVLKEKCFFLLCKRFKDVFFDQHFSAYKIYDSNIAKYHILQENHIENSIITHVTLLSNGHCVIPKSWM